MDSEYDNNQEVYSLYSFIIAVNKMSEVSRYVIYQSILPCSFHIGVLKKDLNLARSGFNFIYIYFWAPSSYRNEHRHLSSQHRCSRSSFVR